MFSIHISERLSVVFARNRKLYNIVFDFSDCKHPKTADDFLKSTPSKVFLFFFFSLDSLMLIFVENV